jgi:18S rRNA (guanine1575-N7)-methyltransferase
MRFFSTLFTALRHGARAVFQFYPENAHQIELITSSAMQSGFSGGLVIDYPNSSKRKKYFLCLFVGGSSHQTELPEGLTDEVDDGHASSVKVNNQRRERYSGKGKRAPVKDKDWVLRKKESRRKKGLEVGVDTKYTARKRKPRF